MALHGLYSLIRVIYRAQTVQSVCGAAGAFIPRREEIKEFSSHGAAISYSLTLFYCLSDCSSLVASATFFIRLCALSSSLFVCRVMTSLSMVIRFLRLFFIAPTPTGFYNCSDLLMLLCSVIVADHMGIYFYVL